MGTLENPHPTTDPARALRIGLLVVLGWWTLRVLMQAVPHIFLDYVNLAFHEAGHVFLPRFTGVLHFLGGTLFQIGIPALLVWYALSKLESGLMAACCSWWVGESLVNVAVYMADARSLDLPLVGGGEHDWNELFFRFGTLSEDSVRTISSTTRGIGAIVMLLGLAWVVTFILPEDSRERLREWVSARWSWGARLLAG